MIQKVKRCQRTRRDKTVTHVPAESWDLYNKAGRKSDTVVLSALQILICLLIDIFGVIFNLLCKVPNLFIGITADSAAGCYLYWRCFLFRWNGDHIIVQISHFRNPFQV